MTFDFSLIPNATLFLMMLALGMELHIGDFTRLLRFPRAVVFGMFGQLMLLPLLALFLTQTLALAASTAVGLMLIAACPGGATSNMFSRYAGGDVALSISLTAISSVLAPLSVPLIVGIGLHLALGDSSPVVVPVLEMVSTLVFTTALPVVLGMLCLQYAPALAARTRGALLATATIVLIILIIGLGINTARTQGDVGDIFARSLLAVTLLVILAAICAALGAKLLRLPLDQSRTLVLEISIQNINLALVIALNFLKQEQYLGPALVYMPVMLIFAGLFIANSRFGWSQYMGKTYGRFFN